MTDKSFTWETKKVHVESASAQWDGSSEVLDNIKKFVNDDDLLEITPIDQHTTKLRVWNVLEDQWLNVPYGHWVVKGLRGEFYPCEPKAMDMKYKVVDPVLTIELLTQGIKGLPDGYDDPRISNICNILHDVLELVQKNGAISLSQIEEIVSDSTEHPDFWEENYEW